MTDSGHKPEDFFIYAMSGTEDFAYAGFSSQIEAMLAAPGGVFTSSDAGQVRQDAEGLHTMRVLGKNMAYLLRCQEAARKAGIAMPEREEPVFTNFVR